MEAIGNRTATRSGEGVQYAIGTLANGRQYIEVNVDQSLFDGLTDKEKLQMAELVIRDRFVNTVIGNREHPAYVTTDAAKEYAHPAKHIKKSDELDAKARVSTELDDLLKVAYNWRNVEDGEAGHRHKNVTGGFDRADVLFRVGGVLYQGQINIAITKFGRQLKDVTKSKKVAMGTNGSSENNTLPVSHDNFSNTTVAQNADGVNTHSMQDGGGYTQNAFLPADPFVDRMGTTPSVTADAVPPPSEREACGASGTPPPTMRIRAEYRWTRRR